jgi:hypothetical protein
VTEKTLSFEELGITAADVYEQMGYHDAQPDKATQQETAMILKEVSQWLRPQFSYFVVNKQPDFEMGNIILRQLRGSEAFALFICTSGLEFEAYQQRLKEQGDMVRVFIADALGSVIAEKCADQMEKALQESIDKLGWKHTNRFSPGYCGWHVSQQQLLFPLFKGQTCGVKLTDSSLMVPIKSVSGIIGVGKEIRKLDYTCGLCNFEKCYKRKLKLAK